MYADAPGMMRRKAVGDVLAQKLAGLRPLAADARRALRALPASLHRYRRQQVIVEAGHAPDALMMVLEGSAARMKVTRSGEHPIVGFLLPGDVFDWPVLALRSGGGPGRQVVLDHTVAAVASTVIATFRTGALLSVLDEHPEIRQALDAGAIVDRSIAHEWLSSIACRPAAERLAHLLCEYFYRMRSMGLTEGDTCPFPFSQSRLSVSQGLSTVHTNRQLGRLQREGLVRVEGRRMWILDRARLEAFADFTPDYLTPCPQPPSAATRSAHGGGAP